MKGNPYFSRGGFQARGRSNLVMEGSDRGDSRSWEKLKIPQVLLSARGLTRRHDGNTAKEGIVRKERLKRRSRGPS